MGKNNKKVLSVILSTSILFSGALGAIPVSAATNLDTIYKNAYDAVMKVKGDKSQQSIIVARKAIAQLAKEKDLKGFVGEFSKQVDGVQQSLFDEFYSLLFVNGKKKDKVSQKEVNKAREYVKAFDTYEGNKYYTASWSSAVDSCQQKLIVEAHEAVVKAMKSKNIKDIEAAGKLVEAIGVSTNKQTLDKSKELNSILKVLKDGNDKEVNDSKENVDKNSEFLNKLNNIKKEPEESFEDAQKRNKEVQKLIESQNIFELGEDYKGFSDESKLEVAKFMRVYMQGSTLNKIEQVIDIFKECKKAAFIFGECMKYKGYHGSGSQVPVINKDIEVGTDITGTIMELVEGQVKNDDIKVTIERAYDDNVLVKDGKIFLNKVNNTGKDRSIGVYVNFASESLGFSSTTNIMATLKSKTAKPTEKITAVELPADIVNIKSDNNTQEFSGGKSTFFNTTVNKERLPKDIKDKFSKISVPNIAVSTADFKIDEKYKNELLTRNSSGVPYTPEGFASVVNEYDSYPILALYSMVILYDDKDNAIAYTIVKIK